MGNAHTLVLDVGKTKSRLTLWVEAGACVARRTRMNGLAEPSPYQALDLAALEAWVQQVTAELAALARIGTIIPVTHGAACVLLANEHVFTPPLDYEAVIPPAVVEAYLPNRDPFDATGSPALPHGLNLGIQLAYLETITPPWPSELQILLWPQYWAWRWSGVAASEVTSLGCHSDLWRPCEARPTDLAISRGWANRLPPMRAAGDVLATVTEAWITLGVPADAKVVCGLHDSNAALLGARAYPEIAGGDATIVTTGTWFIAMRLLAFGASKDPMQTLHEDRDCLLNVDASGRPIPSARFMGGREAELIAGPDQVWITDNYRLHEDLAAVRGVIAHGSMALPGFAPCVGPFPSHSGGWINEPHDRAERRAALWLYLALMTDVCLDLVGSCGPILVGGRFGEAQMFVRALARLRPAQPVFVSYAADDVPFGALCLMHHDLRPRAALARIEPLDSDLAAYRARWCTAVADAAP